MCGLLPNVPNGNVTGDAFFGGLTSLSCNTGYLALGSATCLHNGRWQTDMQCKLKCKYRKIYTEERTTFKLLQSNGLFLHFCVMITFIYSVGQMLTIRHSLQKGSLQHECTCRFKRMVVHTVHTLQIRIWEPEIGLTTMQCVVLHLCCTHFLHIEERFYEIDC